MNHPFIGIGTSRPRLAKAVLLLCAAAWVATAAGCGSAVYGEKFKQRLKELQISSEFGVLTNEPIDGLAINFCVPQLFTKQFNQMSADPENDNKRILKSKFYPSFLSNFPGLQRMFEGEYVAKDAKSLEVKSPIYLYIGEGDPAAVKGKFPYEHWRELIARTLLKPGPWEPVEVQTPKGGKLSWMRLIAKGKLGYDVVRSNKVETPSLDTFFQMWVYETPQAIAILGWWSTEEARVPSEIEKLARLTAGTAVVSPAAAAAAAVPTAKHK